MLREVVGTRYVTALREGGSLPGIVEASDHGTYVVKFAGAGQGTASLVAEVIVGELGRRLGIRVPELVVLHLDPAIGKHEGDPEIQELLEASAGSNLGLDFLPRALGYDGSGWVAPAQEAARIFWLDALTGNIDRSWRNPNLLVWHRQLWAIDHGAALVFHHAWPGSQVWAGRRYDLSDHILAPPTSSLSTHELQELDMELAALVNSEALHEITELVPDSWLTGMNASRPEDSASELRQRYVEYLTARAESARDWFPGGTP